MNRSHAGTPTEAPTTPTDAPLLIPRTNPALVSFLLPTKNPQNTGDAITPGINGDGTDF